MPRGRRRLAHRAVALKPRGVTPWRAGTPPRLAAGWTSRSSSPGSSTTPAEPAIALSQSRLGRTARRRSRARVLVLRGGGGDRTKARGAAAQRRCDLGLRPSRSRGRRRRPSGAPRGGRDRIRRIRRIRPGRRDPVHSSPRRRPRGPWRAGVAESPGRGRGARPRCRAPARARSLGMGRRRRQESVPRLRARGMAQRGRQLPVPLWR